MLNENKVKDNICQTIDKWLNEHPHENNTSFARKLNVTDTSVKRWRMGVCLPDTSLLPQICEIMDISLLTLFGIDNTKGLSSLEQRMITECQNNPMFRSLIEAYFNNKDNSNN